LFEDITIASDKTGFTRHKAFPGISVSEVCLLEVTGKQMVLLHFN